MGVVGVVLVMLAVACNAQTPAAEVKNGDVLVSFDASRPMRLTQDGLSKEAALSPDSNWVAYTRRGADGLPELILTKTRENPGVPVHRFGGRLPVKEYKLPVQGTLRWSPDSKHLYLSLDFAATTDYLARVDLPGGAFEGLTDAILDSVVQTGKYRGKVIAIKRKETLVFPWTWYWLLNEDGTEVGPIGDCSNLREFRDRYCKDDPKGK